MKKIVFSLFAATALLLASCGGSGSGSGGSGDKITAGMVTYKVEMPDMKKEEGQSSEDSLAQAKGMEMIKNMTLSIAFKDEKARVQTDMPGMMKSTVVMDNSTKKGLMLMEMSMMGMSEKKAAKFEGDDFSKQSAKNKDAKITESTETKEIAGYKCKKATVEAGGKSVVIWYTEDIVPTNRATEFTYEQLKGFPLEIETDQDGMKFSFKASEVKKEVTDDMFKMDVPEGYTETTLAEMTKSGGL